VKGECGRVHLPVAPRCNVLCNFCNRKFDCVNESRPGVTSAVLGPAQAARYMEQVLEKEPRITVAGIAGPGDPFANAAETLETMRLIRERFPQLLFCVSTNGLALPPYLDAVAELGVTHMTVTVNAVDPAIAGAVYKWVRDGKVVYRGLEAGRLILARQMESVRGLKARGITVKVNTIVLPGVNDHHVAEIARVMAAEGVDLHNLIPLHPNPGTAFGHLPEPTAAEIRTLRKAAGEHLAQMTHCKRCRADAVGLLDDDRSGEMAGCLSACSRLELPAGETRPYVAVATREGMLVNQHLGEAREFQVWGLRGGAPVAGGNAPGAARRGGPPALGGPGRHPARRLPRGAVRRRRAHPRPASGGIRPDRGGLLRVHRRHASGGPGRRQPRALQGPAGRGRRRLLRRAQRRGLRLIRAVRTAGSEKHDPNHAPQGGESAMNKATLEKVFEYASKPVHGTLSRKLRATSPSRSTRARLQRRDPVHRRGVRPRDLREDGKTTNTYYDWDKIVSVRTIGPEG
jgi:nitrogen fixation protein NifB